MAKTTLIPPFWSLTQLAALLGLGVLVGLSGCASTPTASSSDLTTPEAAGNPVVLLNEDMDHYVAVDNVISTRNSSGYLMVQANIRSQAEKDMTIQAQTLFYDQNGLILNSTAGNEAPWTTIPLTANATVPYTVQALNRQAHKYTIRLRYLGRVKY